MLILNKSSWAQVCTVARRREVIIKFEETTRQNILLILTKPIVMVMRCIALVTCRLIARYVPKNYLHLQLEERESMKPFRVVVIIAASRFCLALVAPSLT